MELLEGFNADTLVRRFGPVPAERVVFLLRQICHSLTEAHLAGLIHRDIKPANIYICRYGQDVDFVKVLDFGLVKTVQDNAADVAQMTAQGVVFGTPAYMAPEQALGRVQDARSDIYAVGCVAYWLLTGHPVFAGDSPLAVLMHHAGSTPVPPSSRTEIAVPRALDDLIMACLAKDAADRPQSAAVLAERQIAADVTASWTEARALDWWQRHHPVGTEIPGIAV
jgi:serine/threonine protein kinase